MTLLDETDMNDLDRIRTKLSSNNHYEAAACIRGVQNYVVGLSAVESAKRQISKGMEKIKEHTK